MPRLDDYYTKVNGTPQRSRHIFFIEHAYRLGTFKVMPMTCPGGFDTCLTSLIARVTFRKNNTDVRTLLPVSVISSVGIFISPGCIAWIFCSRSRKWNQDGGYIYASRWPGTFHLPQEVQAVLCLGPRERSAWFVRRWVYEHRPAEGQNHFERIVEF